MPRSRSRPEQPAQPPVKAPAVSWFPPHMHRAQKRLAREIKHVDVVLELRDARLPETSGNPELERLADRKKRLLLFNKAALADAAQNRRWQAHFRELGFSALFLDADTEKGLNLIYPLVQELVAPRLEILRTRGIRPPMQRLMVVGMPNVGKSTLINRMARGKKQKTAPEPGVTKAVSWVQLRGKYLLMDTPGVMLPRLEDPRAAFRLGWIGAIRDKIFGEERLATALLDDLGTPLASALTTQYGIEVSPAAGGASLLETIALHRGLLRPGGGADLNRAAVAVLADFRAGRLGRITLEPPP